MLQNSYPLWRSADYRWKTKKDYTENMFGTWGEDDKNNYRKSEMNDDAKRENMVSWSMLGADKACLHDSQSFPPSGFFLFL